MHRRRLSIVVALIVLAVTGCNFRLIVPNGAAPLRYRDAVFTAVTKTSNVQYGSAVNQLSQNVNLMLDVYVPTGDTHTARPAIVWVHGGAFSSGDKTSPEIVDEATTFAKKGYVNVSIDYRLSPTGCSADHPDAACVGAIVDAMHDAQAAVRFLRENASTYGIDSRRVAIGGTSAGAITALNVGFSPDNPGTSGHPGFSSAVRAAVSLSGATITASPSAGEAASLLFHGTADTTVPYQWAVDSVTNAQAAGLQSELTSYPGDGHVPYVQHRSEILGQTTNFLYWMLDLEHAA